MKQVFIVRFQHKSNARTSVGAVLRNSLDRVLLVTSENESTIECATYIGFQASIPDAECFCEAASFFGCTCISKGLQYPRVDYAASLTCIFHRRNGICISGPIAKALVDPDPEALIARSIFNIRVATQFRLHLYLKLIRAARRFKNWRNATCKLGVGGCTAGTPTTPLSPECRRW